MVAILLNRYATFVIACYLARLAIIVSLPCERPYAAVIIEHLGPHHVWQNILSALAPGAFASLLVGCGRPKCLEVACISSFPTYLGED
jgi:hypothetical protein